MRTVTAIRGQNTMPLQEVLERPVAYHREFVAIGAGVTGALMLSQALYWSSRTNDTSGWFYKSQAEWEAETGLSRREQETARKKLKELGLIEELKKGVPCRVFFRVNLENAVAQINAQKRHSSLADSAKLDCTKAPNSDGGKRQAITENTAESTSSSAEASEADTPEEPQERIEDLFANAHYRPMTLGWRPAERSLKAYAFTQGVSLSLLTGDLLASFKCHFAAHQEIVDTTDGWTNRLVKWAKAERVKSEAGTAAASDVPFQQIVDLYHEVCPQLAPVTVIDRKLQALISERWAEHEVHQDLEFWRDYLITAAAMNEVFYRGQKRRPYLEAVLFRDVFRDVMEGRTNA